MRDRNLRTVDRGFLNMKRNDIQGLFASTGVQDEDSHWLSVSDLMAGLMVVFLFIAVMYMHSLQQEKETARTIAEFAHDTRLALYNALVEEFGGDLDRWNASIDRETLTIRFREPEVLFERNSDVLKDRFEQIIGDFFPRYINVLHRPAFRDHIHEIRIEGHTSSEWNRLVSKREAYFLNMGLSQRRTRSVLRFATGLKHLPTKDWVRQHVAAVGLSSSRPIFSSRGDEDREASRRVEFRVTTSFEQRILEAVTGPDD